MLCAKRNRQDDFCKCCGKWNASKKMRDRSFKRKLRRELKRKQRQEWKLNWQYEY